MINPEKLNKDLLASSSAYWVHNSNIVLANGDIYSFKDRPYLLKPMSSNARLKCVGKATQLGFSETFIQDTLHGCIYCKFKQGAAYIFPNETEMRTFVQSRFNPLIRDNQSTIGKYVQNTDTTYLKRVGNSNLFFDGGRMNQSIGMQKETAAMRGKSYDKVVLDEYDLMDEIIIEKAKGRMANSEIKAMVVISNPTIENHLIDKLYKSSNQLHWFRKCSCGEWTCPDEEFPDLIDKNGCHCKFCGKVLPYEGDWVAKYTERNDLYGVNSTDWEGYQISQLNSKTCNPYEILTDFNTTTNLEDFWKLRMGRAYTPKENRLTKTEVYDCCGSYISRDTNDTETCMGVDVGKDRYHYIVGIRTAKEKFDILKFGCAQNIDEIAVIAMRMKVKNCVVDIRPYEAEMRRFQKEMRFRVWLCQYGVNPLQDFDYDHEKRIVKCFRTGIFDITHRLVVERRIRIPFRNKATEEFASQYCEPFKYKKIDPRTGSITYEYSKGNGEDHYRNAMNYFYLAASHSKVVSTLNGTKKEKTFVINDTQRYI